MTLQNWEIIFSSLHEWDGQRSVVLPGVDMREMLSLLQTPWDDVDRLLIDAETMGA